MATPGHSHGGSWQLIAHGGHGGAGRVRRSLLLAPMTGLTADLGTPVLGALLRSMRRCYECLTRESLCWHSCSHRAANARHPDLPTLNDFGVSEAAQRLIEPQ